MAWIADGLEERMVMCFVGVRLRWFWARRMANTMDPRSELKAVAVMPRRREECSVSA
jgi:hypothetical protein